MSQRADWARDSPIKTDLFYQLCRDLADESRGCVVHITTVEAAVFSVGDCQFFHRPGNANIGQTSLFLEATWLFQWWPIKAYRPCPTCAENGFKYKRTGQSLDEIVFKKNPAGGYYGDTE